LEILVDSFDLSDALIDSLFELGTELAELFLGAFLPADVDEGEDRTFDDILDGAIGQDAHEIPVSIAGLHLGLTRDETVKDSLDVLAEAIIVSQVGNEIADGPSDVGLDELYDLGGRRSKALDVELVINEEHADASPREQVVHVVVGAGETLHFLL